MVINNHTLAYETEAEKSRKGDYIYTNSGIQYFPLDPRPEEINIYDIAHSLSLQCRYNGHIDKFYSVAEHCWLLSNIVPPEYALEALLHDAAEAYTSDIPRPLKYSDELGGFREVEAINGRAIYEKFGLPMYSFEQPESPLIKEFDARIVTDEKTALFSHKMFSTYLEPLGVEIKGIAPHKMKKVYLYRFKELYVNRDKLEVKFY